MNEQIGRPVLAAYRRGHPAPRLYNAALMAVWGWIAWYGVTHDGAWNKVYALAAAVFFAVNGFAISVHHVRCRRFHAAEIVVITAMKAYELDPEQEKEIMEARRG